MNLYNTILNDRVLWYDGESSYTAKQLCDYVLQGNIITPETKVVDKTESDIKKFNMLSDFRLKEKTLAVFDPDTSWNIPDRYKDMNLRKFLLKKLLAECEEYALDDSQVEVRIKRIDDELKLWEQYNVIDLLRTCIYVIDVFKKHGTVWGTGRGSGCASYLLYLIELHDVDSVAYDIDVHEFFR